MRGWALPLLLVCGAACQRGAISPVIHGPAAQESAMDDKGYVFFSSVLDNGLITVEVHADGRVAGRYSPSPYSQRPEATYEVHIPAERSARIRALLRGSSYRTARVKRDTLRPGEQTLTLGEGSGGSPPDLRSFPFDEVPRSLRAFQEEMDRLLRELK